jgi:hypothetical protein
MKWRNRPRSNAKPSGKFCFFSPLSSISLQDNIRKYIAELPEYANSITLRHLKDGILTGSHIRYPDTKLTPFSTESFDGNNAWLRSIDFVRNNDNQITGFRVRSAYLTKGIWFEKLKE